MIRFAISLAAGRRAPLVLLTAALLLPLGSAPCAAEDEKPADAEKEKKITYDDDVRPILREHCFTCHNQSNARSDLALDSYSSLMQGGASGEVVFAGDLESSRLWALVSHEEEPRMPPEQDRLPEAKLTVIREWILKGALENAGSKAKLPKKPKIDLSMSGGATRPEGEPVMPEGLSRQPVIYTEDTTSVTAIATSPWAPLAAVAGQKQIPLYHTDTGELLGVLPFPEGVPHVLRFSRSGTLLLAGGGRGGHSGKVVVYDVKSGERLFEVGDELDVVLAADINEDHTRIALGGPQRVVRIYDTADGSLLHEITKHTEWIYSIEYSPDGVLLATGDRNGDLFVWEAETAREYQHLKGHSGALNAVSWRGDSNVLASASEDGTVRLWEMENGKQVKSWNAHGGGVASIHFAHDGRLVSAGRDRVVKIWDQNGAEQKAMEALPDLALAAAFTHDGARVIGGDWRGEIRMWDVAEGTLVAQLAMNPPTLEMVAEATAAEAAAAQAEAEKAAAELAEIEKLFAERKAMADETQKASEQAAEELAAAKSAAESAEAAAKAADEALAALKAAIEKAEATKAAVDKSHAEKAEALAAATKTAGELKEKLEKIVAERDSAQKTLAEKKAAAEAAAARAANAKAAAEKAAAELSAAKTVETASTDR